MVPCRCVVDSQIDVQREATGSVVPAAGGQSAQMAIDFRDTGTLQVESFLVSI